MYVDDNDTHIPHYDNVATTFCISGRKHVAGSPPPPPPTLPPAERLFFSELSQHRGISPPLTKHPVAAPVSSSLIYYAQISDKHLLMQTDKQL